MTSVAALPDLWATVHLHEIADVILGQSPPGASYNSDGVGIPFFQGKAEFGDLFPTVRKWTSAPTKFAKAGDILLSVRAPVGPTNIAAVDCAIGRGLAAIRPRDGVEPRYVLYALRESAERLAEKATGTTFGAVAGKVVRDHLVALAPSAEQRRIVAAIEEQFSRLDAGIESLERARRSLRRMRASVLMAAVEGRLTNQNSEDQPAELLLKEIQEDQGRMGRKVKGVLPPLRESSGLPVGWAVATVGMLAAGGANALAIGPFGSDLKVSDYRDEGIPLVFVRNVRSGVFAGPQTKFVSAEKAKELSSHLVRSGDVLITKMGDPPGDAIVYPSNLPDAIVTADVIKVTLHKDIDPEFMALTMNSPFVRTQILSITKGVAQLKVSLARFRSEIMLPVPPLKEQRRIVAEVERQFSMIEHQESAIAQALARADRLRRSLLSYAFSGRLVPQDSRDEPAAKVLEDIASSDGSRLREGARGTVTQ